MVRSLQISARWRISRQRTSWRDLYNLGAISAISASSPLSRRDGRYLAAISPRFRIQQTSWRDLGEISAIWARSHQSRRDLADLGEISPISIWRIIVAEMMKKLDSKLQKRQQGWPKISSTARNCNKDENLENYDSKFQMYARAHSGPRLANLNHLRLNARER